MSDELRVMSKEKELAIEVFPSLITHYPSLWKRVQRAGSSNALRVGFSFG